MKNMILGLGEVVVDWVALIDHFPEPDEKIDSKRQDLFSGGVTANYIVAAARLGASTKFFGCAGNDEYYNFLETDFVNENVDPSFFIKKNKKKTPVNFIFVVEKTGEKVIIQSPYMHTTIPEISDLNENIFKNVKVLHTTGIYPEITLKAFEYAKNNNIITTFDLEKQIAVWGQEKIKPMLKNVNILMPNKAGAMELTDTKNPIDAAKKFLNWGIKLVVITLGAEGSIAITDNQIIKTPAFQVKPVDTTGAGDTFCAAFDYAYILKEFSLKESCIFANAAACLKVQKLGARTGMPTINQIKQFLEEKNFKLNL